MYYHWKIVRTQKTVFVQIKIVIIADVITIFIIMVVLLFRTSKLNTTKTPFSILCTSVTIFVAKLVQLTNIYFQKSAQMNQSNQEQP